LHVEAKSGEDAYLVEGNAGAEEVHLRGQPAELKLAFRSKVSPANPAGSRVHLHQLAAKGPGLDLSGTAMVALTPMAVEFDLKGKALDVGQLLSALPPKEEPGAVGTIAPQRTRSALETARVTGSLAIEQVQVGKLQANGLSARIALRNGVLTAQSAEAQLYGGSAALGGTSVDLKPETPAWNLRARLQGLEVGELLQGVSGAAPLRGIGTVELTARGFGTEWERIRRELTGQGRLTMKDPVLGADLSGEVGEALGEILARTGQVRPGPVEKAAQGTRLGAIDAHFEVRDGWMSLRRPVKVNAPFGSADLGGRVGLDQRLDLRGTARLSPSFVGQVSSGQLKPSAPLDVPMRLTGNLSQPKVGLDVSPTDLLKGFFGRFRLGLGAPELPRPGARLLSEWTPGVGQPSPRTCAGSWSCAPLSFGDRRAIWPRS
ncbi:MAG: AsmA family protein, partial [Myxococcaceae bacterium]